MDKTMRAKARSKPREDARVKAPRRGAAATRAAILSAARDQFATESYENVGLREVAAQAGADASLVGRYFGSKEELFTEVVRASCDPSELTAGEPVDFAKRMADALVNDPPHSGKIEGLLIMMRSASSPVAAEIVQKVIESQMQEPFAAWIGGEKALVRAKLASVLMLGMAVSRAIMNDFGLTSAGKKELRRRLEKVLNAAIEP